MLAISSAHLFKTSRKGKKKFIILFFELVLESLRRSAFRKSIIMQDWIVATVSCCYDVVCAIRARTPIKICFLIVLYIVEGKLDQTVQENKHALKSIRESILPVAYSLISSRTSGASFLLILILFRNLSLLL